MRLVASFPRRTVRTDHGAAGVTDLTRYAVDPAAPLLPDLFLD